MSAGGSSRPCPRLVLAVWSGVVLLGIIGVAAALARAAFVDDLATRIDPFRDSMMRLLDREDPFLFRRAEELARFDSRFAAHPVVTLLHVLPGALFLALAPLQFSSTLRNRHLGFHRWSGRILVVAALVAGLTGLYFGLLMPFGGWPEALAIALFGGLLLVSVSRAFLAIRRHDVKRHREWMIRAFSLGIAVSTVRVVGPILDVALSPAGLSASGLFALAVWTGWVLTAAVAEVWIRTTRTEGLRSTPLRSSRSTR
jgi:uncharacterized membrane protein